MYSKNLQWLTLVIKSKVSNLEFALPPPKGNKEFVVSLKLNKFKFIKFLI